ncbi:nuclear transport factor 2 family protein, partial [Klebsiella pneumoniae]
KFFKGPKEIFERQKEVMEAAGKGVKATVTTVDLWLDGEIAYETGTYSYKYQEKGKPVTEEGRYVTIWKRQSDGSWKIITDMGVPKS